MTNIEELEKKYRELEEEIERPKKEQEFNPHDDKLFLLSEGEYNLVRENIEKHCSFFGNIWWWLRSLGCYKTYCVRAIDDNGNVYDDVVDNIDNGVVVAFIEEAHETIGTRKVKYDFPFVYVGNNLWVSEAPILAPIFWSRFDEKSNDYEKSEIRQKILEWANERE